MQTPKGPDIPLPAFGALLDLLELRGELATCLWVERQITVEMGFEKQFLPAPHPCMSWLRLEPICAGVPFISVLAAGSALSFSAGPSRNRGGWMQCVTTGVRGTPWALADEINTKRKMGK